MASDSGLVLSYLSLGLQALTPIIIGSFKSLKTPASTIARRKKAANRHALLTEDDEDEEDEGIDEMLSWSDSLIFPIFGSVALLSLWLLLKYVGKEWINLFFGIYFSGAGIFAFQSTAGTLIRLLIRQTSYTPTTYHVRITSNLKQIFHLPISLPSLLLLPFSFTLPLLYVPLGRPYILSNVLALCLATTTLALLKLDSFFTAFLLLGALLVYDIFWVFATPVMVTVAKGIDAPIKLLSPKPGSSSDFAMLGLGDIVIPGMVIALCLRFDLHLHVLRNPTADTTKYSPFKRVYFWTGMVSYVIGLVVTMGIMHYFRKAQPALLYLSPACTLGPILVASIRGELAALWTFNDSPDKKDEDKTLDETIEAPSAVAMQAKQAGGTEEQVLEEIEVAPEEEDDSWMEDNKGAAGAGNGDGKPRKRKGGKKK